jgi:hypothetical protein
MPATGKKFADESEVLSKIRRLEQKINAIRDGSLDINLGGATQDLMVCTDFQIDGGGHITSSSWKTLSIVDGVIERIV